MLLLAILFAGCLHFVNLPEESNWHRIQVTGAIVYAADPDSPIFARSVVRFPAGLNDFPQSRARLMRPLYSVAGWIVFQPLSLFEEFVPPGLARRVAAKMKEANNPDVWRGVDSRRLVLAWGSLVIVNVIMIWGSLVLVRRALLAIFPEPVATLLSASLPFHFTIIRWVYVPHTEPFDLLIPAVFLYTAARIWSRGGTGWMGASVLGILLLGKPIAFPAFNWLYEHLLSRPRRSGSIRTTLLLLGMLCAPTALYAGLLMKFGIRPEWFELSEYRQVTWMMDYVRAGRVSDIPVRWADNLVSHVRLTLLSFAAPFAITGIVSTFRQERRASHLPPGLVGHLVTFVLAGCLFWDVGRPHCASVDAYPLPGRHGNVPTAVDLLGK